jgi:hypothetical protein
LVNISFSKSDIGRIVDRNIINIAGLGNNQLSQEQLIKVFKESIYESIQKYHEELGKFLNRNTG